MSQESHHRPYRKASNANNKKRLCQSFYQQHTEHIQWFYMPFTAFVTTVSINAEHLIFTFSRFVWEDDDECAFCSSTLNRSASWNQIKWQKFKENLSEFNFQFEFWVRNANYVIDSTQKHPEDKEYGSKGNSLSHSFKHIISEQKIINMSRFSNLINQISHTKSQFRKTIIMRNVTYFTFHTNK